MLTKVKANPDKICGHEGVRGVCNVAQGERDHGERHEQEQNGTDNTGHLLTPGAHRSYSGKKDNECSAGVRERQGRSKPLTPSGVTTLWQRRAHLSYRFQTLLT
jgi:hypothetical protein